MLEPRAEAQVEGINVEVNRGQLLSDDNNYRGSAELSNQQSRHQGLRHNFLDKKFQKPQGVFSGKYPGGDGFQLLWVLY